MTVPALTTTNIGAFAWWRQDGCYSVELSDVLDYVVYYEQQPEYIDTILFLGVNRGPVNVRIRSDGYILAWYSKEWSNQVHTINSQSGTGGVTITPDDLSIDYYYGSNNLETSNELAGSVIEMLSGTHSGKQYLILSNTATTITVHTCVGATNIYESLSNGDTFRIYSTRGALPYNSDATSLGYAIHLIWEQLKSNQIGGSGASLTFADINNYDYEYTNATSLHVFGSTSQVSGHSWYMTQPNGNTIYTIDISMYNPYDYSYSAIKLNNTNIIGLFATQKYNIRKIDASLLRSIQVRNQFYYYRNGTVPVGGYEYLICLTND